MEEEKAAAYYDDLTRKGEGAAKFKQGLGFSTSTPNDAVPKPGSALVSSSSFLSQFVKASSSTAPTTTATATTPSVASESDKKAQLQSIQNKLKKKPTITESRVSEKTNHDSSSSDRRNRRRSRSRDRYKERGRDSRRRSRSRERYNGYRDRDRSRSRSRSDSDGDRGRDRRQRERGKQMNRSVSPRKERMYEKNTSDVRERGKMNEKTKVKNVGVDYAKLIEGYDKMAPAERVKAKMKLQLSETAARDSERGVGWERFEFNKDAPLDDEEEIEVAEDDVSLVKHIGQSFRFSAVESKREEQIQAAHEEAMFGSTAHPPPTSTDSEPERENEEVDNKKDIVSSLLSETVLAKQKGSWRDRVRQA